ncbi:hypothetical protein F5Y19DRAFT_23573 [Xylariaceae sp. FL1651]|nr:hypothetical protein F5Y19DRAFT_23573 [Xylariaceae sp. FL1651]
MPYFGSQKPKFLVPARNSRHRIACFALYRALLRLAPQISLPDDLATGWGENRNPITIHIQRAFRRNVADVSPRIVYPALSAGYRMLSVLHDAAASPSSEHHTSILSFLRRRLEERKRSLVVDARNRSRPPLVPFKTGPPPSAPRPGTLPLLVNVTPAPSPSNPDPRPEYATPHRPRPPSELGGSGRRQIPRIDMANDIPFLRLTKPQPAILNRVIRQKVRKRYQRTAKVGQLQDAVLPDAQLEDEWEEEMARLMREEKKGQPAPPAPGRPRPISKYTGKPQTATELHWRDVQDVGAGPAERSHTYTIHQHGVMALSTLLTRERVDQVARADAMRRLIIQEKALAAEEKAQKAARRRMRWEAIMRETHGEGWRALFPNLEETREQGGNRE